MNLLQSVNGNDNNELTTSNFRNQQYDMIPDFCKLIINYLNTQTTSNTLLQLEEVIYRPVVNYFGVYNSQVNELLIRIKDVANPEQSKSLLQIIVPKLIEGTFFFLNGNFYIPGFYVIDYPIVIKKQSMKLSGLFNSITFHMKEDIVVFARKNIQSSHFIQLFIDLNNEHDKTLYSKFQQRHPKHRAEVLTYEYIVNYFCTVFNKDFKTKEDIIFHIHKLFMDDYTYNLYLTCYPKMTEISLPSLIRYTLRKDINREIPSFIDLTTKRLVFIEMILRPIFEKVASLAVSFSKNIYLDLINMNQLTLIKHFLTSPDDSKSKARKGLGGNFLYNTANLYSGILANKICMIPIGIKNAPKEIQAIHESHFGKICPISISSQKPGHLVSVVSDTKLDHFGRFI